jgi:TRAP-type C4-dicarboxylate transport system permease small subunit
METLKRMYGKFCMAEEFLTNIILATITALVLVSALARTLHHPINWAVDISLLLFAWQVFLGGDIAIRNTNLIGVEMLIGKLPMGAQKNMKIAFFVLIIAFLSVLVFFGIPLTLGNRKRLFQVLPLSYSWCTLSVPVGAFLMIISSFIRLARIRRKPAPGQGSSKED